MRMRFGLTARNVRSGLRSRIVMVIRVQRFRTWAELVQEALRLADLGFICEVRGWEDMMANKLTISTEDEE